MKQGYLPVFDFIAHIKEKNKFKGLFRLVESKTTRPEGIVIEKEDEEDGGNGPEDNGTSNPMCNSVAEVRHTDTLFQITMAS